MPDKPPDEIALKDLAAWRPAAGVLSLYVRTDPADRGEGWRIELKDGLRRIAENAKGALGDLHKETRATAERVYDRLTSTEQTSGRCQVGFVEVGRGPGREHWYSLQTDPGRTILSHWQRPHLLPLIRMVDEGAAAGVVLVSMEAVKVLEWEMGMTREVAVWSHSELDRLEPPDRGSRRGAGTGMPRSGTGGDVEENVEANRERFLKEMGDRLSRLAGERGWREVLAFGEKIRVEQLSHGFPKGRGPALCEDADVINESRDHIDARIAAAVADLNRRRELALVARAKEASLSPNGHGCTGAADTLQALRDARVDHLVLSGEPLAHAAPPPGNPNYEGTPVDPIGDEIVEEEMIEHALLSGATVTPADGPAAVELAELGGVAALLRY